jgi:GR25 family glycosyltransferase involved in LPS biosynthesis
LRRFSLDDAEIVYINLAKRTDRAREIQAEFKRLDLKGTRRFEAIESENGGLGCALSHHATLSESFAGNTTAKMVCEDDVEFLVPREVIEEIIHEFLTDDRLDVLCLGNALIEPPIKISAKLSIANTVQTTSCYVLKPRAAPYLINSALRSAEQLEAGKPYNRNALDQVWKRDQQGRLFFAVPNIPVASQRPSFSDIEKRKVSYRG